MVFRRELRAGDVVDVTCDVKFGSGKTFKMDSNIFKLDGTLGRGDHLHARADGPGAPQAGGGPARPLR